MQSAHEDQKQLQRNDRVAKWIKDNIGIVPAADTGATGFELGTETGLLSDLHDESLYLMRQLGLALQAPSKSMYANPDQKAQLDYCYGKLNVWGDILQGGKLEASLAIVPILRQTTLEALVKIGQALLLGEYLRDRLWLGCLENVFNGVQSFADTAP